MYKVSCQNISLWNMDSELSPKGVGGVRKKNSWPLSVYFNA